MENGVISKTEEGSPQGGPLSPLLANIYLNEFDQEMLSRGGKVIPYADDIVVLAKSRRAAKRLLEICRRYLEGKLKLKMNVQKSKVVSVLAIKHFKFLGFCLGYYHVADIKRILMSWNEWLRRRFRMYIWKHGRNQERG